MRTKRELGASYARLGATRTTSLGLDTLAFGCCETAPRRPMDKIVRFDSSTDFLRGITTAWRSTDRVAGLVVLLLSQSTQRSMTLCGIATLAFRLATRWGLPIAALIPCLACERSLDISVAAGSDSAQVSFEIRYPRVLFSRVLLENVTVHECDPLGSGAIVWMIERSWGQGPDTSTRTVQYGDTIAGFRQVVPKQRLVQNRCYFVWARASHGATRQQKFLIDDFGAVR